VSHRYFQVKNILGVQAKFFDPFGMTDDIGFRTFLIWGEIGGEQTLVF
jgi:hypothetical protein